jgi:8-oxo-dGTP pyrophosphatase MutT (NUDIX family)
MATKRLRNNTVPDPGGGAGAAPAPTKRPAGAFAGTILVTYRNIEGRLEFLVGRETKFLTDIKTIVKDEKGNEYNIEYLQRADKSRFPEYINAKQRFTGLAQTLTGLLRMDGTLKPKERVLADIIETSKDGKYWTIHFRIPNPKTKFGFVKGHRKGTEEPKEVILREFAEETGTAIDHPENLVEVGSGTFPQDTGMNYAIFVNHVDPATKIIENFNNFRFGSYYGELSELKFRPLNELWGLYEKEKLNKQTTSAIDTFFIKYFFDEWDAITKTVAIDPTLAAPAPGGGAGAAGANRGGARTRRMRRRKMRKTRRSR